MTLADISIKVEMPRRRAEVIINPYWASKYNIEKGPTPCHVLGLMQESDSEDAYPVFVCELLDGRIIEVAELTAVTFVDTDEKGEIR